MREEFQFQEAVGAAFLFLEELGFKKVESLPTFVKYRKELVTVEIYHGRQSYEVGLNISDGSASYSITDVIPKDSARSFAQRTATTKEAIGNALSELALALSTDCPNLLDGDKAAFAELANSKRLRAKQYELEVLAINLRPSAERAFRHGDYAEAVRLYEKFDPVLSESEKQKLAIARRRSAN